MAFGHIQRHMPVWEQSANYETFFKLDKLLHSQKSLKITFPQDLLMENQLPHDHALCLLSPHSLCLHWDSEEQWSLTHLFSNTHYTLNQASRVSAALIIVCSWPELPLNSLDTPPTRAHSLTSSRIHTAGSVWSDSRIFGFNTQFFPWKDKGLMTLELGIQPAWFTVSESAVKAVQCT